MKEFGNAEKSLIPNVFVFCNLLIVNLATPCAPARFFSTTRRLETWLRSRMNNRRFNLLGLLNAHKELIEKLDLAEVGNEFIYLNKERFSILVRLLNLILHKVHDLCVLSTLNTVHRSVLIGGILWILSTASWRGFSFSFFFFVKMSCVLYTEQVITLWFRKNVGGLNKPNGVGWVEIQQNKIPLYAHSSWSISNLVT